jgi:hypothetical protein
MAWPHSPLPSFSCVSFRRGLDSSPLLPGGARLTPLWPWSFPSLSSPQLGQILKTSQPAPLRHHSAFEALLFRHLFTCRCTWSLALRFADGPRASCKSLNSQSPSYPFAPSAVLSSQAHRRPPSSSSWTCHHRTYFAPKRTADLASLSSPLVPRRSLAAASRHLLLRRFRTRVSRKPS